MKRGALSTGIFLSTSPRKLGRLDAYRAARCGACLRLAREFSVEHTFQSGVTWREYGIEGGERRGTEEHNAARLKEGNGQGSGRGGATGEYDCRASVPEEKYLTKGAGRPAGFSFRARERSKRTAATACGEESERERGMKKERKRLWRNGREVDDGVRRRYSREDRANEWKTHVDVSRIRSHPYDFYRTANKYAFRVRFLSLSLSLSVCFSLIIRRFIYPRPS